MLLLLATGAALRWLQPEPVNRILSCRNELYDNRDALSDKYYMQADFVLQPDARIYYRYFTRAGEPVGHIAMTGKVLSSGGEPQVYRIAIDKRKVKLEDESLPPPEHLKYLAYTSGMRISEQGSHNLSITLLEVDEQKSYAAVYFTPANAVCSCSMASNVQF